MSSSNAGYDNYQKTGMNGANMGGGDRMSPMDGMGQMAHTGPRDRSNNGRRWRPHDRQGDGPARRHMDFKTDHDMDKGHHGKWQYYRKMWEEFKSLPENTQNFLKSFKEYVANVSHLMITHTHALVILIRSKSIMIVWG